MAGTLGKVVGTLVRSSGATVAGLVQGQNGANITQASLSAISYTVYRVTNGVTETSVGTGGLTVSSAVFDSPVTTDPRYTLAGGYNFLATIPAGCFATPGATYRIVVTFVPVSGEQFNQIFEGAAL